MQEKLDARPPTVTTPETDPELDKGPAAVIISENAPVPIVVVCEHASLELPKGLGNLGLTESERHSHIAWDPGAAAVAEHLAKALGSVLVKQRYSRLVYDCNRPPTSPDAMRAKSENTIISGNQNLPEAARQWRTDNIYTSFHNAVAEQLDRHKAPTLITIHSFTPVYDGNPRAVDVGILHDDDTRLADAILAHAEFDDGIVVARNEPYGPRDGVTHTLQKHGLARQIPNVMIEIKNSLIADDKSQRHYADQLAATIKKATNVVNTGQKTD